MVSMRTYYRECGIELLPFLKDQRGWEQLKQIQTAHEPPPLLRPSMADLYRSKVEELASALQREDTRL